MELHVIGQSGLPDGCVLSVRSGTVRRQAPMSSGKAFKFPSPISNPMKIDAFAPVASGHLVIRPGAEEYRVDFNEGGGMCCDVQIKDSTGDNNQPAAVDDEVSKKNTASEAKDYLAKHQILEFVQAVLHTIITEKPQDPYTEMARHFMCGYRPQTDKSKSAPTSPLASSIPIVQPIAKASEKPTEVPKEEDKKVEAMDVQTKEVPTKASPEVQAAKGSPEIEAKGSPEVTPEVGRNDNVESTLGTEDLRVKLKDMLLCAHDTGDLKTHLETIVLNGDTSKTEGTTEKQEMLREQIKTNLLDQYEAGTLEAALGSIAKTS